jgi:hypothetical protein
MIRADIRFARLYVIPPAFSFCPCAVAEAQ